ncbi:hypothetical protein LRR18_04200 [Mangrovimonas sp. AS39]|uniref:hypothetical protein n=1 Tax=Mangrovimonas futianensis TaxID=2895523 RepID=UPI001E4EF85A|nr:hypothetical protein [Mangrovimonas futianensis]MCF1190777.1 hypothetical protein [Mangrovimonas futianensis]MCF1194474.1 hypothetical protein [Mangrovimonas futianensis]
MKRLLFISVWALIMLACNEGDEIPNDVEPDNSNLALSMEVDHTENLINDLVVVSVQNYASMQEGRMFNPPSLPACATATLVVGQNSAELTLDFGSNGCSFQGYVLQGQIVMNWNSLPDADQVLVQCELIDFYVGTKQVQGNSSILYEIANDIGNPQSTHSLNLTVIWPNGQQIHREGEKIREWIEGYGNMDYADNVYLISGYWTSTFVNGNVYSYEVLNPLRREATCSHFVSGSMDVQRPVLSGVFDFGEGDCDNLATFTLTDGTVIDVVLDY